MAKGGPRVHITGTKLLDRLSERRHLWLLMFDAGVWMFAVAFAAFARLDFDPSSVPWDLTAAVATVAACLFTVVAWITRLPDGRSPLGSLDEMIHLGTVTLCVGVLIYFANLLTPDPSLPRSVPLIATLLDVEKNQNYFKRARVVT